MSATSKGSARFSNNRCWNARAPNTIKCCPKCKKTGFDFNVVIETDDDKPKRIRSSSCSACSTASSLGTLAKNAVGSSVSIAKQSVPIAQNILSGVLGVTESAVGNSVSIAKSSVPIAKTIINGVIGVTGAIGSLMDFPPNIQFSSKPRACSCLSQPPSGSCHKDSGHKDSGSCSSKYSQCSNPDPGSPSKVSGEYGVDGGRLSKASGEYGVDKGRLSKASGEYGVDKGRPSNASGEYGVDRGRPSKASSEYEVDITPFTHQYPGASRSRQPGNPSLVSTVIGDRDSEYNSPFKRSSDGAPKSFSSAKPLSKWGQRRLQEKRRSSLNYVLETDVIGSRMTSDRRTSEDRLSEPPNIPRCSGSNTKRLSKACSFSSLPRRYSDGGTVLDDNIVEHHKGSIGLRKCVAKKCLIPSQQRGCRSSSPAPGKCSRYTKQGSRYVGRCTSQESVSSARSYAPCTRPPSHRPPSSSTASSQDDFDQYVRIYKPRSSGHGLGDKRSSLLFSSHSHENTSHAPQAGTSHDLECEVVNKGPCSSPGIACKLVPVTQSCKLPQTCPCGACCHRDRRSSSCSSRTGRGCFECDTESLPSGKRPCLKKTHGSSYQSSEQATDIRRESRNNVTFERPTEFVFHNGRFTEARSLERSSSACANGQCKRTCANGQCSRKCAKCGKTGS